MSGPGLAFSTEGSAAKPAVMLLHGIMSCNAQWMLNAPALARDFFLVMVEMWGHGNSPEPRHKRDCSIDAYIGQFEAIRRALKIGRWSLIGQSYGAGLVLHYAHRHPDICHALVVTNSRSAFGDPGAAAASRPRRNAPGAGAFDPRRLPFHPIHSRRIPEEIKEPLVKSADAMTRQALRWSAALAPQLNSVGLLAGLQAPLTIANGTYEKSFQADLARIRHQLPAADADALALRGRAPSSRFDVLSSTPASSSGPRDQAGRRLDALTTKVGDGCGLTALRADHPGLEVVDLPGGHSVNIECARQFNEAVSRFLARAAPQ